MAEHEHPRALPGRRPSARRARQAATQPLMKRAMERSAEGELPLGADAVPDARVRVRGGHDASPPTRTSTTAPACATSTIPSAPGAAIGGDASGSRTGSRAARRSTSRARAPTCGWTSRAGRSSPPTASTTCPTASSSPARSRTRPNGEITFTCPPSTPAARSPACSLRFEGGRVVDATAEKGEEFLIEMLDTDEGARRLGELGIGTNYGIDRRHQGDPARREDRRHGPPRRRHAPIPRPAASTSPRSTGTWSATSARAAGSGRRRGAPARRQVRRLVDSHCPIHIGSASVITGGPETGGCDDR